MSATTLPKSFDAVAAAYDRARPGYPQATFERIVSYAGLEDSPSDLLEIGTGTGKATRPLAALGHRIVCLEPGANLACVASANLVDCPKVSILVTSFEDWAPDPSTSFQLVFAAQAFHWIDPTVRLRKAASLLRPDGALAVFGNSHSVASEPLAEAIQLAYRRHAPALAQRDNAKAWYGSPDSPVADELAASEYFTDVDFHAASWTRDLSADAYCELAATYSDHSTLPGLQRQVLLKAIAEAINQRGDSIQLLHTTALFLARRC
jgi:SAM-dependent methyltransferase